MSAPGLEVVFIDELYPLAAGEQLTFGREADLLVDESNPYMHRRVGTFLEHRGVWWVRNDGARTELTVRNQRGRRTELPSGESAALTGSGTVQFVAGAGTYEIAYLLDGVELPIATVIAGESGDDGSTREFGVIDLNPEQRLMLTAMSERRLRDPNADSTIPSRSELAHRLGWSVKKFDRKLDYLCARLADEGVPGLRGGKGIEANERRENLVQHAVSSGMIGRRDLDAFESPG